ncbi:MAG: S-methyl-5-thioribose-1-phosphate isomerase [Candidatus Kapaibacteriales bacterium]
MKINGKHYTTLWESDKEVNSISVINQKALPFKFEIIKLKSLKDFALAIKEMYIRGAPLIGITACYALYFAVKEAKNADEFSKLFGKAKITLLNTRPTAVNLKNAILEAEKEISNLEKQFVSYEEKIFSILNLARKLRENDILQCKKIGEFGLQIIQDIYSQKNREINILTHCNAGWLATIDYGTALAPIYLASQSGIPLHVWVDETRPRNQGARLTCFELLNEGIPYTLIVDNSGGLLMQKGLVDLVIVGTDRVLMDGSIINKVGTYLKALAAKDNGVPFYVSAPSSSFDNHYTNEFNDFEIEIRHEDEVKYVQGLYKGNVIDVLICPEQTKALNYAFDITPANYITALITERGICKPNQEEILNFYPEKRRK